MEPINVLIAHPFPAELLEKLANVSPRLKIAQYDPDAEDTADRIEEAQVYYTSGYLPLPEDAPNLKWVQLHSAGFDGVHAQPLYTDTGIIFTSTSGIHAVNMAEYTLAQMLAFSHRLPQMFEDKEAARWVDNDNKWERFVPTELRGQTLGIVGYGSIGREIARLSQAFGMTILAVKRDLRSLEDRSFALPDTGDPEATIPDRIYPPEALKSFLGECDFVVVTVPLTAKTRRMIDTAALAAMKPGSIFINIARGDVVDEPALIKALESGHLGGAALDVFSHEPLPGDSPLWQMPNVIISPHIAGATPYYDDRATDLFAENLSRFVAGEKLINAVDRALDY
jgi:phosphoglycerate dehydrogenase-like enzyme